MKSYFRNMAKALVNKQIDSVGEEERALQLAMIANTKHNPIISDYSTERPSGVKTGDDELQAVGSLDRLNNSNSVSFWDYQTKIWHVRVNFTDSQEMVTEFFQVTVAESSR
jgi:hypothetical protein